MSYNYEVGFEVDLSHFNLLEDGDFIDRIHYMMICNEGEDVKDGELNIYPEEHCNLYNYQIVLTTNVKEVARIFKTELTGEYLNAKDRKTLIKHIDFKRIIDMIITKAEENSETFLKCLRNFCERGF